MNSSVDLEKLRSYLADSRTEGIGYPDLRRHILTLAERGRLTIVDRPINKDTEMHPLVRWQFRGARLAVAGEYEKVGETVEKQRRSDVEMNQTVRV